MHKVLGKFVASTRGGLAGSMHAMEAGAVDQTMATQVRCSGGAYPAAPSDPSEAILKRVRKSCSFSEFCPESAKAM